MGRRAVGILLGLAVVVAVVAVSLRWGARFPGSPEPVSEEAALLNDLEALARQDGDLSEMLLRAREIHATLEARFPDSSETDRAHRLLENFHIRLLFSSVPTENSVLYVVKPGDTLSSIARHHGTTVELIKHANGLSGDFIRAGQSLKVIRDVFNVRVDKSENRLWLKRGDSVLKTYTVSTGKDGITPVGEFTITDKLISPTWYKAGAVVPPDSPDNVLGTRWMGIGVPGYGIHGTTEPETLGQAITEGCVRMENGDVEELYAIIPSGTQVVIVD